MIRQENVRGTSRSNPVGITAVGQDFCIKYLVWPNLGNNLKEKMVAFDTSNHYIGTFGKLICCDWNL